MRDVLPMPRPISHVHVHLQQKYFMNVAIFKIPMFIFTFLVYPPASGLRVNFKIFDVRSVLFCSGRPYYFVSYTQSFLSKGLKWFSKFS